MRTIACVVLVAVGFTSRVAAEAPTDAEIRAAVERSLPYLAADGVKWMRDRACITCHQIPAMVWSFNEAARHGLTVDAADVKSWNRWAVDNGLKRAVYYKLTEDDLAKLAVAGPPADVIRQLAALKDENYVFEADFRNALTETLAANVTEEYTATLLQAAAKTKQGGGGGNSQNQYMALLLSGAADEVDDPAAARQALAAALAKSQKPDGTWEAAGQFLAQQRSKAESVEVITRWSVLALDRVADPSAAAGDAAAKAEAWLDEQTADVVSMEALMLRALFAHRAGDSDRAAELVAGLVEQQHADGGWGWLRDRETSDPFTTGLVLYGLGYLERDPADAAVRNGAAYLLRTQGDDGVWQLSRTVISKAKKEDNDNGDYIYTYWTTGWAVIGLLSTLPN